MKILQNCTKTLICEERLFHWKSINEIFLQIVQGEVGLSVAVIWYVIQQNVRKLFNLRDSFGQVVKKLKYMLIFCSYVGFILIDLKRSNIKPSLKNFSLPLSNSVNNVVADRHLYFNNFENDKREEVYSVIILSVMY